MNEAILAAQAANPETVDAVLAALAATDGTPVTVREPAEGEAEAFVQTDEIVH